MIIPLFHLHREDLSELYEWCKQNAPEARLVQSRIVEDTVFDLNWAYIPWNTIFLATELSHVYSAVMDRLFVFGLEIDNEDEAVLVRLAWGK